MGGLDYGVEEVGKTVAQADVYAVIGAVLGYEDYFSDTLVGKFGHFGGDLCDGAGDVLAPDCGDYAEGALVVAALGDFDVGCGAVGFAAEAF